MPEDLLTLRFCSGRLRYPCHLSLRNSLFGSTRTRTTKKRGRKGYLACPVSSEDVFSYFLSTPGPFLDKMFLNRQTLTFPYF